MRMCQMRSWYIIMQTDLSGVEKNAAIIIVLDMSTGAYTP